MKLIELFSRAILGADSREIGSLYLLRTRTLLQRVPICKKRVFRYNFSYSHCIKIFYQNKNIFRPTYPIFLALLPETQHFFGLIYIAPDNLEPHEVPKEYLVL